MNTLARLEKLIEQFVEGLFERLFSPRLHPADLARTLAREMELARVDNGRGNCIVPNHYIVFLTPADFQALHHNTQLRQEISAIKRYLHGLVAETSYELAGPLQVQLVEQADLSADRILVQVSHVVSDPDSQAR